MDKANEPKMFGSRISACRQNRNMTQEELADRLGVTPQALSKWERGISLPDVFMLADLSRMLGASVDYLLGIDEPGAGERAVEVEGDNLGIGEMVRGSLEAVELVFGEKVVSVISQLVDNKFQKVFEMRKRLSEMGIILPVVRIRDFIQLEEQEFAVLAYNNALYSEKLDTLDENTVDYMLGKLEECVCKYYHEILNPDLIKDYIDILKIKYPALIEGVVPEKISYSLLTETVKIVVSRGNSIIYLPKMIEVMDCALRESSLLCAGELADRICRVIEREDNIDVILGKRREKARAEHA